MEETEFAPLNLWIRQDQMDKITKEAYDKSTTIYSLIRNMIDYYYDNKRSLNEETNISNKSINNMSHI